MEHVTPQLKDFIVNYCSKYKMREIDAASLALHTSIDLDLDIVDIEIDLFIDDFAAHFRIDTSKFTWYKYGYPTGSSKVTILKMLFGYRRRWVKRLAEKWYTPKLRISTLQRAMQTGKLL